VKTPSEARPPAGSRPTLLVLGEVGDRKLLEDWGRSFDTLSSKGKKRRSQPALIVACLLKSPEKVLAEIERASGAYPTAPVVALVRPDDAKCAVEAARRGANDIMLYPASGGQLERVWKRLRFMTDTDGVLCEPVATASGAQRLIITRSPQMIRTLDMARRAAETDATVLLTGESGTGKELLAAYIHAKSARAAGPFFAVNCAALPIELAESELFGHERGAFTGASWMREGKFELSHTGTLLLDEIGEMDMRLQAKLLRVLEDGTVWRIGASKPISADVRTIATTNADLARMAKDGRFREDLFYRLEVISIRIPPLRERREDIPVLIEHFLSDFCQRYGRPEMSISPEALRLLESHVWPGNVRELQNVVERAVLMSDTDCIEPQDVALDQVPRSTGAASGVEMPLNLDELERVAIERALEASGGNRTSAAKLLGITARTLRNKLARYRENFSHLEDCAADKGTSLSAICRASVVH